MGKIVGGEKRPRKLTPAAREELATSILSGKRTRRQAAKEFKITPASVVRILRKAATGNFADAPRTGRPEKLSNEDKERIKQMAETDPNRSIRKIKHALAAEGRPKVSNSTIGRILHESGYLPLEPERIQLKPGLSGTLKKLTDSLTQFEEARRFADDSRSIIALMQSSYDGPSGPASEEMAAVLKDASTKYGVESENGRFLQKASDIFVKLGEEERTFSRFVKSYCIDRFAEIDEDTQLVDPGTDGKDVKTMAEEVFVAKRKLRNAKKNRDMYREQSSTITKAFQARKDAIEHVTPRLPQHRQKQCQAVKAFLEAQRVFHLRAAGVIENALPFL